MERVVITGIGVVGPHGVGLSSLLDDKTAPGASFSPWPENLVRPHAESLVAQVSDLQARRYFTERQMRLADRAMLLAATAAGQAIEDADLQGNADLLRQACSFLGTARAELPSCYQFLRPQLEQPREQLNAADFPKIARNIACGQVAIRFGLQGPSSVLASGPLSSLEAASRAAGFIRRGQVRMALVGGFEALSRFALYHFGLHRRSSLSGRQPAFFGQDGEGMLVPSEGACMLLLESLDSARQRGARIHAEVLGARAGRVGDDEDAAQVLLQGWEALLPGREPAALVLSSGGGCRAHERAEAQALAQWCPQHPRAAVHAPRAAVGEGDAWTSALQLALGAAMLERGQSPSTASPAPDAGAALRAALQPRALDADAVVVSAMNEALHFNMLALGRA